MPKKKGKKKDLLWKVTLRLQNGFHIIFIDTDLLHTFTKQFKKHVPYCQFLKQSSSEKGLLSVEMVNTDQSALGLWSLKYIQIFSALCASTVCFV